MKRLVLLLLALPLLNGCYVEDGYYVNDYGYYQPAPVARVQQPPYYGRHHGHYHGHSRRNEGVYYTDRNHSHGHGYYPAPRSQVEVQPSSNYHGHPDQGGAVVVPAPESNTHGHPAVGIGGEVYSQASNVHGHD